MMGVRMTLRMMHSFFLVFCVRRQETIVSYDKQHSKEKATFFFFYATLIPFILTAVLTTLHILYLLFPPFFLSSSSSSFLPLSIPYLAPSSFSSSLPPFPFLFFSRVLPFFISLFSRRNIVIIFLRHRRCCRPIITL